MVAHNINTLSNNPCFARIAEEFYQDIANIDQDIFENNGDFWTTEILQGRPSLSLESGKGMFLNLRPGWLYEKALDYSKGNPYLAFSLLSGLWS